MADVTLTNFSLYYSSITINSVLYPVVVAKVKTTPELFSSGDEYDTIQYPNNDFKTAIGEYCKGLPVIAGCGWGSYGTISTFFSPVKDFSDTDANGYTISQKLYSDVRLNQIIIEYKGFQILRVAGNGSQAREDSCAKIPAILVNDSTNELLGVPIIKAASNPISSPNIGSAILPAIDGKPPFGVNFTSTGIPYCTSGAFGDYRYYTPSYCDVYKTGEKPPEPTEPFDPYEPGGPSGPGGGGGDFDNESVPVDIPPLPQVSATDTGFISLFNPTLAQLQELSSYMWSDLFDINGWKKIFADPMDAILGLSIVPVAVPDGGTRPVVVGNISTGVNLTAAQSQYVEVDCGTINVNEYWGAYLDYDPYTKAELYLPYIGTHALAADDIMKKPIHVVYHVDILSGACCAYVKCGESVLYSFVGQCSCSIPVTSGDWSNMINGALSIATSIGMLVATDGASAPMSIGSIASAAVNSLKPNIEKSGSMGGMGGMLGIQTPYLILTRPSQALAASQNTYMGYPSFITLSLGECSGYTEVESIHLENISATGEELTEIESLLKEGVIL